MSIRDRISISPSAQLTHIGGRRNGISLLSVRISSILVTPHTSMERLGRRGKEEEMDRITVLEQDRRLHFYTANGEREEKREGAILSTFAIHWQLRLVAESRIHIWAGEEPKKRDFLIHTHSSPRSSHLSVWSDDKGGVSLSLSQRSAVDTICQVFSPLSFSPSLPLSSLSLPSSPSSVSTPLIMFLSSCSLLLPSLCAKSCHGQ